MRYNFCVSYRRENTMSTILKEVYDAFLEAGVSEKKSTAAAKAIADYDEKFGQLNNRFNKVESDLLILKWMVGLIIVVNVLPMLRSLFLP